MTLGGAKILLEEVLKACTSEQWPNFHLSKFTQPINIASVSPQFVQQNLQSQLLDSVWSFLDGKDCHVTLENSTCVDVKSFSSTSIRNVVLVLQLPYKLIAQKSLFKVDRFSDSAGSNEKGKGLVGRFEL